MRTHSEFASEEVRHLLAANGLRNLKDAFEFGEPLDDLHAERACRHDFKRIVKLDLNTPGGASRVYIKRQWRRERLLPRPTDIRHRIALKCSPIHEWRGLQIMQKAGFHVSEPLAVFWRGWGFSSGAVVTRSVPTDRSLADFIVSREFERMAPDRRNSLIEATVSVVARMNRARLSWRSMKAKHFYPEETAYGEWRIWLIDCEGVSNRSSRNERRRQWSAFLQYVTVQAPALKEAFLNSYSLSQNI